ncbi:hypothetical protein SynA1544_02387 [Synechococcus sp. A15-44]|nr:hypothetical protein SynA1544_02387 [Synechococcus sp. A15-44]
MHADVISPGGLMSSSTHPAIPLLQFWLEIENRDLCLKRT